MEPEISLPHSQESATGTYPNLQGFNPHLYSLFV